MSIKAETVKQFKIKIFAAGDFLGSKHVPSIVPSSDTKHLDAKCFCVRWKFSNLRPQKPQNFVESLHSRFDVVFTNQNVIRRHFRLCGRGNDVTFTNHLPPLPEIPPEVESQRISCETSRSRWECRVVSVAMVDNLSLELNCPKVCWKYFGPGLQTQKIWNLPVRTAQIP